MRALRGWSLGFAMGCLLPITPSLGASGDDRASLARGDCERDCRQTAKQFFKECREAGGSREECDARADRLRRECLEECVGPTVCQAQCHKRGEIVVFGCLLQGGSADECAAAGQAFVEECVASHCQRPPDCRERCVNKAWETYRTCLGDDNDGDDDDGASEEECAARAREVLARCLEENCENAVTCPEKCAMFAERVTKACLDLGGSEEECGALGEHALERCLAANCADPPGCEQRCADAARDVFKACVESGEPKDECAHRARRWLKDCLEDNCHQPPGCVERCTARARHAVEACVDLGGDDAECDELGRIVFERCVRTHCAPPTDCEEKCVTRARRQFRECVAQNPGSAQRCAAQARELLRQCVADNCPEPPTCADECQARSHRAFEECKADGGPERQCRKLARDVLHRCLKEECVERCGGIAGETCDDDDEFCKFPPGSCDTADALGVCVDIPDACPEVYQPVCGCDGETYANECFAIQAGVSIDYRGECRDACGGIAGLPCDDGEFCKFRPGTCDVSDNMGVCEPVPQVCPDVVDPVCGCDGTTYGNECEASMAGVSIDHRGECHRVCDPTGTREMPDCPDGSFCMVPPGVCDTADVLGVCVEKPGTCPLVFEPVCGCDGVTYGNRCLALQAGVSIDHSGMCQQQACGSGNDDCGANSFCKLPPGACDDSETQGVCMEKPVSCPAVLDPVCGCNGVTYTNPCEASAAGVSIRHAGTCGN